MKFAGTLLNLDGVPDSTGDIFPEDCDVTILNPVIVTHEFSDYFDNWLGTGTVKREGNVLLFEIDVDTDRISKELYEQLTPAVGGFTKQRIGKKIVDFTVNEIGLTSKNADPRIEKLKVTE